jgi:PTH1 family peptidyl-tRNA hydrolase
MNRSGGPVARRLEELGLEPADLLVCYDELALPLGRLRIRPGGSDAGHNGMRSLIDALGTDAFPRLRFGIRPEGPLDDGADFVLSPFRPAERRIVDEALGRASEAVASVILDGVTKAMARYNAEAPPAAR